MRILAAVISAVLLLMRGSAMAAEPKTSLPDIEDEVMCVSCDVALNVAESPQAYRQREFIRTLVEQGQINARLVDEHGENVLAMPEDDGIGLAALLVPIAAVLALLAGAAVLLPRWRRRAHDTPAAPATAGPQATDAELSRLDADLRRFART